MTGTLIFDLDGTLVDSCAICVDIVASMLEDRGAAAAIDPVAVRPLMSIGGTQMIAQLLGPNCGDPEAEIIEFRTRYAQITTPTAALFEHVSGGLQQLRDAGFRLAICSNKPQELCEKTLIDVNIAHHFDSIVGSRVGIPKKPDVDLLKIVVDEMGSEAKDCVLIGDSDLDCQVASRVGMPFVFVTYGYAEPGWSPGSKVERFDCFGALCSSLAERVSVSELV